MSNFTPGPWEVVKDDVLGFIIPHPTDDKRLIARVPNAADAYAIALMPEMYAMLKEFEDIFAESGETGFAAHIKLLLMRIDGEEEPE